MFTVNGYEVVNLFLFLSCYQVHHYKLFIDTFNLSLPVGLLFIAYFPAAVLLLYTSDFITGVLCGVKE